MARAFVSVPAQTSLDALLAELDAEELEDDELEIGVPWETKSRTYSVIGDRFPEQQRQ